MTEPFEREILEINLHKNSFPFTDNQWNSLCRGPFPPKILVLMENSGFDKVVGAVIGITQTDNETNKIRLLFWPRFTNCLTSDLRITNLEFNDNNMLCAIYVGVKSQNE